MCPCPTMTGSPHLEAPACLAGVVNGNVSSRSCRVGEVCWAPLNACLECDYLSMYFNISITIYNTGRGSAGVKPCVDFSCWP